MKWKGAVSHFLFSPLQGAGGKTATIVYLYLASLLSDKWNSPHSFIMYAFASMFPWFFLLCSLCLDGSHCSSGSLGVYKAAKLAVVEGHLMAGSNYFL